MRMEEEVVVVGHLRILSVCKSLKATEITLVREGEA